MYKPDSAEVQPPEPLPEEWRRLASVHRFVVAARAHRRAARRLQSQPTGWRARRPVAPDGGRRGDIVGTEATERMSGLVDGWSRREARGYEIALLAVVLPAAAALAIALFGDTRSAALLLLGILLAEGAVIGLLAARLRATSDQPEGQVDGGQTHRRRAQQPRPGQAEDAVEDRPGETRGRDVRDRRVI